MAKGDELQRVGRAVAARRGQLGMTQQELADAAHVDLKTIYNLESGTRWPIAKNRAAVSTALGWAADALTSIAAGQQEDDALFDATPEMERLMSGPLDEIEALAAVARRKHPGRQLAGKDVFPFGPELLVARWDMLVEAGWRPEDIPLGLAYMTARDEEADAEARGNGAATGLTALRVT